MAYCTLLTLAIIFPAVATILFIASIFINEWETVSFNYPAMLKNFSMKGIKNISLISGKDEKSRAAVFTLVNNQTSKCIYDYKSGIWSFCDLLSGG